MYKIIKSYNPDYGLEVYNVLNQITKRIDAVFNTYEEAAAFVASK